MENSNKASYLGQLNHEQIVAVEHGAGAILVLAGAGSGKTRVLTARIINLIENGASPYEILALTFTNKAAKEMQSRLTAYLGEDIVRKMWVGTFHSICGRILRKHLETYKTKDGRSWNNNYVIYDDSDTKTVIKNAVKKFDLDEKIYDYKLIKTIISNAKNKMQDAHAFASMARDYKNEKISEVYYEYEKQLALNNAIDFDDMLLLTVNMFDENATARNEYAERFKNILIDEFQDTNGAQYKLCRMLFNDVKAERKDTSLMVVGDVDQSIYSWRGADFKILLNFKKDYPKTTLIKLEQNYRSSQNILTAANQVIKNNEQRVEKNLYSTKGNGEKIKVYCANSDYNEANYVAKKIRELNDEGVNYENIAVLYRTNAQSRSIEEALMSNSLPYRILGGLKFYDRAEIKDILAYLKLIYNTSDSSSLKRIINVPKRSIGATTFNKILDLADENGVCAWEILENIENYENFSPKVKQSLINFRNLINDFKSKQNVYDLSEFVSYVLEYSGYLTELKADDKIESQSKIENLQEFINVVKEFEEDGFVFEEDEQTSSLGVFLSQVALVSDVDGLVDDEKSITLMTLHSAKGLEFPVVFLVGLEEGLFPHSRALSYQANSSELEEERRLMYVGITRAKEDLYLTFAKKRMFWGDLKTFPKSRFLDEISPDLIDFEGDDEDEFGSFSRKSSFSRVVKKIRSDREENNYKSKGGNFNSKSNLSTSFKNINSQDAPLKGNLASSLKHIIVKKNEIEKPKIVTSNLNKPKESSKIINKNVDLSSIIAKCKQQAKARTVEEHVFGVLPIGTRVFHSNFGVGFVRKVENPTNAPIYTVEFQKHGMKQIDGKMDTLKTF